MDTNYDPVTMDPTTVDWDFPPATATVLLDSHGDNMNGIIYMSQGPGPHPSVILLHGYPGDERHLDLAHAIRRSGWNVLLFHYRGAWGSGGVFNIDHALEDTGVAIDLLRRPESQQNYRVDPDRIALVGHSLGGYLEIIAGSKRAAIRQVAALAPVNLGPWMIGSNPHEWDDIAASFDAMSHGAVKNAMGPQQNTSINSNPEQYDLLQRVAGLDGKSVLIVGATRDEDAPLAGNAKPLAVALRARNKAKATYAELDADHGFSSARIALARLLVQWLSDDSTTGP